MTYGLLVTLAVLRATLRAPLHLGNLGHLGCPRIRWQPLTHNPRRLMVECVSCGHAAVNETNGLRRAGWQASATTPRRYRCGDCASSAEDIGR